MQSRLLAALIVCGTLGVAAGRATAQQVTASVPFNSVSDSFYERIGTSWRFNWNGLHGQFGGNMAVPPFGGFTPNAGLNGGFAILGPGSGFLNFSLAQGWRQSLVSQSPGLTLINGGAGYFSDSSVSPFVIGYVPVVGGFAPVSWVTPAPLPPYAVGISDNPYGGPMPYADRVQAMRQQMAEQNRAKPIEPAAKPVPAAPVVGGEAVSSPSSSATRAAPSVAEARWLHELEQNSADREVLVLLERGRAAEEDGKPNVARICYQMAVKRAGGELRQQAIDRLESLKKAQSSAASNDY